MNIPKKLKVGGTIYTVKQVKEIPESEDYVGMAYYRDAVIAVDKTLENSVKESVFIHELVHALFNFVGLEQDEEIVTSLGHALYMVIADNPEVFK